MGNRPKTEWRTVSCFLTVPVTWLLFYGGKWDQLRNRLKGMMDRRGREAGDAVGEGAEGKPVLLALP